MGSRLSGTLAIACMDKFEKTHVYRQLQPIFYGRYVDDIGTLVKSKDHATHTLQYLNSKHDTIKFEMELPDQDGYLPILDIKMKVEEDGRISRRLYVKAANKGLMLNFRSHQPLTTKIATMRNELQRATTNSTAEHRKEAENFIREKLERNQFPTNRIPRTNNSRRNRMQAERQLNPPEFIFRIPFISDTFNGKVKRILRKNKINARLVNDKHPNIERLTADRSQSTSICSSKVCTIPDICQHRNIVYEARCNLCSEKYIGQTTRTLHERAREHYLAAKNKSSTSALGNHYADKHPTIREPSIGFTILQRCRDELRLKIREAMEIKVRKPSINRRREELGTGYLP